MTVEDGVRIEGGGTIVLDGGSFLADGSDVTFDNLTVRADSASLLFATQASGAHVGWAFTDCVFDNVSVRLTAPGRTQDDGSTASTGTAVVGATMDDCEHRNFAGNYAIELGGVDGIVLTRPWVHNNGVDVNEGDGIKVLAGSDGCRIVDGTIEDNTRDGIDVYDSVNTEVSGCTISDNGADGIDAKWGTGANTNNPSGYTFHNNTVERNGVSGIDASTPDTTVTSNTCRDNGHAGVRVGSAGNDPDAYTETVEVSGNVCTGNVYGVLLGNAVRFVTVDGNEATGNDYGVYMTAKSDQCTITNNVLTGNTTDGLAEAGTDHTISGNTE